MEPRLGSRGKKIGVAQRLPNGKASMEPRLGSRGKSHRCLLARFKLASLQWSRDLEVAERKPLTITPSWSRVASMEPRLGSRGKRNAGSRPGRIGQASMEPRLGSRGKDHNATSSVRFSIASMEPRLGSRGKSMDSSMSRRSLVLQWSRDLEVAERPLLE